MTLLLLPTLALLAAPLVAADTCYSYGRPYYCNSSGLAYGARIGIAVAIAVGGFLIIAAVMFWRRRQVRNQFAKFRPPALPFNNNDNNAYGQQQYTYGQQQGGYNPYASNPPPPNGQYNQGSNWNNNQYGNNPSAPAQVYQPSTAGQYGGFGANRSKEGGGAESGGAGGEHEHGYEWAQARENERLERERAGAEAPPPGYDVTNVNAQPTGGYAPPTGPPPSSKQN